MPVAMEHDKKLTLKIHEEIRSRNSEKYIKTFGSFWEEGFKLKPTYEHLNPYVQTINITLNNLFASYSLQEYQRLILLDTEKGDRDYFWFLYHIERLVSEISTLIDLKLNLANQIRGFQFNENKIRSEFHNKLKKDDELYPIIFDYVFQTKHIRNAFTHGIKPYLFTDEIIKQNGIYAFGRGKRQYNLLEDHWKIEHDFLLILDKLDKFIELLELERLIDIS